MSLTQRPHTGADAESTEQESAARATISELRDSLRTGRRSLTELAADQLNRLDRLNSSLNAFLSINERLLEEARQLEEAFARDPDAYPLAGGFLSVKDLMPVIGLPTTAGSKVIGAEIAADDAPAVARLRAAGCLVLGKTNLHEFAYGVTTENEHFGATRNPWAADRVAGGSSGGSACALAAGLGNGSVGTDTRGSIRIPSSCCGVTGLKPTFGLVSTDAVIPLSWSLDHVGPMARSVEDAFALLGVMTGRAVEAPPASGLRGGLCPYYFENLDARVEACVEEARRVLEAAGLQFREVDVRELHAAREASGIIARAEAVTYHDANLTERPHDYGPLVRTRLETGYQVSALDLVRAQRTALRVRAHFEAAFEAVDFLLAPVIPGLPPPLGSLELRPGGSPQAVVPSMVRLNAPQNVAGVPALSLPGGFADGLPVGIQLVAARDREAVLCALGTMFQQHTDWHLARPDLAAATPAGDASAGPPARG